MELFSIRKSQSRPHHSSIEISNDTTTHNATNILISHSSKQRFHFDALMNTTATYNHGMFFPNSKEENANGSNNEFSSGYHIRFWELIIVIFVIILWLASLYRFIRSFDMLRITHHREMPYKYRMRMGEQHQHQETTHVTRPSVIHLQKNPYVVV